MDLRSREGEREEEEGEAEKTDHSPMIQNINLNKTLILLNVSASLPSVRLIN